MAEYRVINAADAKPATRKAPAELIMESVGDGYKSVGQMAQRYGVHKETIRRLIKSKNSDGTPKVKAPSEAVQQGGLLIYLFNEDDVAEMDEYFSNKGYIVQVEK